MTNAGGNKFDDSLIISLQLATKLEDAVNRIAKETPSPTSYFHHQYNLIYTLGSNLVNMYRSPSVHRKCRQTSKFPSYMKGRHPQYKIKCRIPEPQSLLFFRLQCHY